MVYGEGAGALILESRRHAQQRGAQRLARLLGFAAAFEPCQQRAALPRLGHPPRHPSARSKAAKLATADIGYVIAHGASTLADDRVEAQALRATFGDVPVTAPKSYFGHLGAAAGASRRSWACWRLSTELIPPTLNYEYPDPQCPINVIHGQPLRLGQPNVLILSHSPNGQAVALVLGGVE